MSTEADERLSTLLCELVADIENSVVRPDPRGVMSPPVPDGAQLVRAADARHERGRRGTTRKVVGAAAAAAVLAGVRLAGVFLAPIFEPARPRKRFCRRAAIQPGQDCSGVQATRQAAERVLFHRKAGGALVEGKAFAAMVDDTWETWYRPASSTATGLEVGAMSIPAFVSGYGKQAWVRAKETGPELGTNPRPRKPRSVPRIGRVTAPVTSGHSLPDDRRRDLDERCVQPLALARCWVTWAGFPGPLAWGRCSPGCKAPLPTVAGKKTS